MIFNHCVDLHVAFHITGSCICPSRVSAGEHTLNILWKSGYRFWLWDDCLSPLKWAGISYSWMPLNSFQNFGYVSIELPVLSKARWPCKHRGNYFFKHNLACGFKNKNDTCVYDDFSPSNIFNNRYVRIKIIFCPENTFLMVIPLALNAFITFFSFLV